MKKTEIIAAILALAIGWCLTFSTFDAGSLFGLLDTRAVEEGDERMAAGEVRLHDCDAQKRVGNPASVSTGSQFGINHSGNAGNIPDSDGGGGKSP